MSVDHGELLIQNPISDYAIFIKNLVPKNIDDNYSVKPPFLKINNEENIKSGIVAFRDFLFTFCDVLKSHGDDFYKPKKVKNPADYSFLHDLNQLLIAFGYNGELKYNQSEEQDVIKLSNIETNPKISTTKLLDCLKFLNLCGFDFLGIDLNQKKVSITETEPLLITFPNNPIMLTGLKALATADVELRSRRYSNDDYLFRCDYRLLKSDHTDMSTIISDFVQSISPEIQNVVLNLHNRYCEKGLTCDYLCDDAIHYSYANLKNSKRVMSSRDIYQNRIFEISASYKHGFCLVVRSKKTEKYAELIESFPQNLKEAIKKGYGCDRKLHNEPCKGGCQGIRLPLNKSIIELEKYIMLWLDAEIA